MAQVTPLKPIPKREPMSAGMKSLFDFIHSHKKPVLVEISKGAKPFKVDSSWNCEQPISELMTKYQ